MKVDIRVPVGLPVQETADFIAGCEGAGFSGVGVHDHQHSGRDVFLTLALAAERTSRLTLYPATTNPVTRHPMVLASLAHSLEEVAPERIRLTVGPGYLAVGNIGRPRATVAAMRRAVLTIRRLLRGERVEFNGVETRLRNVSDRPTPVFMTAAGAADGGAGRGGCRRRAATGGAASQVSRSGPPPTGNWSGASRAQSRWLPNDFHHPKPRCRTTARPPAAFRNSGSGPTSPYLKYPSDSNLVWLREAGIDLADDFAPGEYQRCSGS